MPVNNNLVPSLIATRNSSNQPSALPENSVFLSFCSLVRSRSLIRKTREKIK